VKFDEQKKQLRKGATMEAILPVSAAGFSLSVLLAALEALGIVTCG
jgi:hypothetical protein